MCKMHRKRRFRNCGRSISLNKQLLKTEKFQMWRELRWLCIVSTQVQMMRRSSSQKWFSKRLAEAFVICNRGYCTS